jgi:hypothetical protein
MNRLVVVIGLLFGCLFYAGASLAQTDKAGSAGSGCAEECRTCADMCEKTLSSCEKQGGKHTEAKHLNVLKDCISACKTSHDFMKRGSEFQNMHCNMCQSVCEKCAQSCESFKGDKQMKACADKCRTCATACKKMAG